MEAVKHRVHRGDMHPLYFWRNNIGTEVDLLLEDDTSLTGVEIKSGQTLTDDMVRSLHAWQRHTAAGQRRQARRFDLRRHGRLRALGRSGRGLPRVGDFGVTWCRRAVLRNQLPKPEPNSLIRCLRPGTRHA